MLMLQLVKSVYAIRITDLKYSSYHIIYLDNWLQVSHSLYNVLRNIYKILIVTVYL
jgi:hypothetical protein